MKLVSPSLQHQRCVIIEPFLEVVVGTSAGLKENCWHDAMPHQACEMVVQREGTQQKGPLQGPRTYSSQSLAS